jgi:8-oxo-dGTP diphosphatase
MKYTYINAASTVDLIVHYDEGIVLIRRKHEPFRDYWALPGGFLEQGKETLEEAACRELFEETSLRTKPEYLKLIGVYSAPDRDPRGHVVDHIYEVTKFSGELNANDDAAEARVFKYLPRKLAFDHKKIIKHCLRTKR